MAKTPEAVHSFLKNLSVRLLPFAEKELAKLVALKEADCAARGIPFDGALHPWDFQYYNRILLETEFAVDEEKIKEYFSFDSVTTEMLSIYQQTLGLVFEEKTAEWLWNSDVKFFKVTDAASGELVGHFYLDLFPRDGKYTHAACFPLTPGYEKTKCEREYPVCAIVANFGKPTPNKPSLLTRIEVITYFHELGHAMHHLCSKTKYSRFHGTNVETDFVEAPSQMLENWCFDKTALKRLSKHYQSGNPIPDDLIEAIIKAKNVNAGLLYLRQVFFGTFDMFIHSSQGPVDTTSVYAKLKREVSLVPIQENTWPAANFGHMMGGYDSGYYGYLWSQVFSADMFYSRFDAEGIENTKTGMDYRRCILQPGGSKDGMDLLVDFLGRKPTQDAFFKSIELGK